VIEHLKDNHLTEPFHHAIARISVAEDEATNRAISLSNLISTPILIVHVSSAVSMARIRAAQNELEPIFAETCPQYLLKLANDMIPSPSSSCPCHAPTEAAIKQILDQAHQTGTTQQRFEGAKLVCSPPVRESPADQEAVWKGVANGTVTTFSSDHCPSKFDHPKGKKKGLSGDQADFTKIPNGLAGVETRQPLLMTYGVETGRSEYGAKATLTGQYPLVALSRSAVPSRRNCMACNIAKGSSRRVWMRISSFGTPKSNSSRR
jgi:dihydropyrimidinase